MVEYALAIPPAKCLFCFTVQYSLLWLKKAKQAKQSTQAGSMAFPLLHGSSNAG
jgi:hypothetical protein